MDQILIGDFGRYLGFGAGEAHSLNQASPRGSAADMVRWCGLFGSQTGAMFSVVIQV